MGTTVFFTKKQKKQMRERQRRKQVALKSGSGGPPKKASKKSNNGGSTNTTDKMDETAAIMEQLFAAVPETPPTPSTSSHNKKKRSRAEEVEQSINAEASAVTIAAEQESNNGSIVVPANLTAKQAKKFRKDARREVRSKGLDDTKLRFREQGDEKDDSTKESESPTNKKKKQKKEFPRINEIIETAKQEKEKQAKIEARDQEEKLLPEAYKKRYLALDCEMVGIGSEGRKSALARVSITDWYGTVVLDTFVQVPSRVTDFRTHVSGVKPKNIQLDAGAMDVKECRDKVAAILKDNILVGHALKNDLHALMLQHPREQIRDTAKYRPFQRYGGHKWRPRKLRDLAKERCGILIQREGEAHNSIDDANAAMELFKFARKEWEEELEAQAEKKMK